MRRMLIVAVLFFLCAGLGAQSLIETAFTESDITLKTKTGNIYGSLVLPNKVTTSPIVLIIAGSGPTDRNGNSSMGVQCNTYKMIAEVLAKSGISSVRYDKRGIAQSKPAGKSEIDLRFENYIEDAEAWIALLKADTRFTKVFVLGHSEGSLIGMIAAATANAGGYISVAGVGRPADQVIQGQLKDKLPPALLSESHGILDSLKMGLTVTKVSPSLQSLFRPSVQPYMISWFKYDPAAEIKKLRLPVFIIQGKTDIQVSVEDAKLLANANPDAGLLIIERMNHVLKESEADQQSNLATYKNPNLPLKKEFVGGLISFIQQASR